MAKEGVFLKEIVQKTTVGRIFLFPLGKSTFLHKLGWRVKKFSKQPHKWLKWKVEVYSGGLAAHMHYT